MKYNEVCANKRRNEKVLLSVEKEYIYTPFFYVAITISLVFLLISILSIIFFNKSKNDGNFIIFCMSIFSLSFILSAVFGVFSYNQMDKGGLLSTTNNGYMAYYYDASEMTKWSHEVYSADFIKNDTGKSFTVIKNYATPQEETYTNCMLEILDEKGDNYLSSGRVELDVRVFCSEGILEKNK